jgi:acetyl esterase/lipase
MLDVVFPKVGNGPFPAVILLHGTGPANQGKKGMLPLAQELARQGYVAIAVSYRCKPEDAFPAPIGDVQCAIHWVRDHANQYKIDKDRIGVLGFSGGGTLACLLGMNGTNWNGNNGPVQRDPCIRAVVSFYAPTDFPQLHQVHQAKIKANGIGFLQKAESSYIILALENWLGGPPAKVPQKWAFPSPMTYVTKNLPAFLLLHGGEDTMIPAVQSLNLASKLKEFGNSVVLLIFGNAGHDFEQKSATDKRLAIAAVLAFLEYHLKPKAKP